MDKHGLIVALKDLALKLGRTPTRFEFITQVARSEFSLRKEYGSYVTLVQAAGLDTVTEQKTRDRKGLTNHIFVRDLEETLLHHEPQQEIINQPTKRTLVVPDSHFPFENKRVIESIYRFAEKNSPERIVQIGDLYDLYCHSKFPRSQNVYSPQQEEQLARAGAQAMWETLRKIAPNAECVQLKGNHDIRPLKRTLESLPSLEHVIQIYLDKLMTFDGVKLIEDPRQEYIVDGIEFIHGHYSGIGRHRDYALMNAVCGHIHVGGVSFKRIRGQTLWELNAGFAGDPEAKALGYTSQKITHWTPGFGWIDEYGPRFIPA